MLFHSSGIGSSYIIVIFILMTNSKSPAIGLSNEVLFVSESCVWLEWQIKMFFRKLPVRIYLSTSVHKNDMFLICRHGSLALDARAKRHFSKSDV